MKESRTKIALISDHADPAIAVSSAEIRREKIYLNGQSIYVGKLGFELSKQGFEVDMFTQKIDKDQPNIVEHNDYCRTIRLKTDSTSLVHRDQLYGNLPKFLNAFLKFQERSKVQYDLIHTHYWLSGWIGLRLQERLGLKHIHTYHSLGLVKYKTALRYKVNQSPNGSCLPEISSIRLQVEKECLDKADCVIATSPKEYSLLKKYACKSSNVSMVPCGTDIFEFGIKPRISAREKLGIDINSSVVLYVGRFEQRKGIEILVRAIHHSQSNFQKKLQLVIVGDYSCGKVEIEEFFRIKDIIDELGIHNSISFQGRVCYPDVIDFYSAANVCVVPSLYEPFGLVAIEAMSCGIPVIASDVGGLQYTVVPEETGLLVPPNDVITLSKSIDRLISDSSLCSILGHNGEKRIKKLFTLNNMVASLKQIYASVLSF